MPSNDDALGASHVVPHDNIKPKLAILAHPKAGYAWAPAVVVLIDIDANFETVRLVEGGNTFTGGVA